MSALRWMIIFASHAQKFGDLVYAVIHILKKFVEDFLVAVHGAGYMCVRCKGALQSDSAKTSLIFLYFTRFDAKECDIGMGR